MGQLDQEIAKLAVYVGEAKQISVTDVDQLVGSSRTANIFRIFDALGEGKDAEALDILERLFDQGEDPIRMLGAFSMQLRRLAQTARLVQRGLNFGAAADRAGIPPFARQGSERQLRQLGRTRANRLYDWLLEADLGMKGWSQLPPRTLLERLVVKLAK
jgi:DNA polymerase-3 subunit delta